MKIYEFETLEKANRFLQTVKEDEIVGQPQCIVYGDGCFYYKIFITVRD